MYNTLIKKYIDKLTENDIKAFAQKNNHTLSDEETKIIYSYIKNYWQIFYQGNPQELFLELQQSLSIATYQKVIELYKKYKKLV